MKYTYYTKGTCSSMIILEIENDTMLSAEFMGGCNGNLQGICKLIEGMKLEDIEKRLRGIRCGMKTTSCPDQLCQAIDAYKKECQ